MVGPAFQTRSIDCYSQIRRFFSSFVFFFLKTKLSLSLSLVLSGRRRRSGRRDLEGRRDWDNRSGRSAGSRRFSSRIWVWIKTHGRIWAEPDLDGVVFRSDLGFRLDLSNPRRSAWVPAGSFPSSITAHPWPGEMDAQL
jgi:hypothetical protein